MAGLLHLLFGIVVVSAALIGAVKAINQNTFGHLPMIVFGLLLLVVLVYRMNKGWQIWSVSWIVYMFILAISLLNLAVNAIPSSITSDNAWI